MFGVVILMNPGLVSGESLSDQFDVNEYPHFYLGIVVSLVGSGLSGFAWLYLRRLGTWVHACHTQLYFGTVAVIVYYITAMAIGDQQASPYDLYSIVLLVLFGSLGWLGLHGISMSMQVEKGGRVAPINYL